MRSRIVVMGLVALAAAGCASPSPSPVQPASRTLVLAPADDATGVRLDAPVMLDFGVVVAREVIEGGMHLISEADIGIDCSEPGMGAHGTMEAMMGDPAMLQHLNDRHRVSGRHSWNASGTAYSFRPDSLMQPDTRYMVHMSAAVVGMLEQSGIGMGAGRMHATGDMTMHFRTTTEGDHASHHP